MSTFQGQMEHLKAQFKNKTASLERQHESQLQSEKEMFTKALETTEQKINSVNKMHDSEVSNVFEDTKTLGFIQKMRGFKGSWQQNKTVQNRKSTAGQMAEATKNWISSYE